MLKRIKTLFKDNILIIAICITIAIIYLSLIKITFVQPKISNLDKLEHSFAYFVLTFCWLIAFYKKPKRKYIIVISCILFGIIIEVLQTTLTSYRTGDYLDILANTSGVLVALFVFNKIILKK